MDTAKDARILVAEDALQRLSSIMKNRRLKLHLDYNTINAQMKQLESSFYELKYSYTEPKQLVALEPFVNLVQKISSIGKSVLSSATTANYKPASLGEQLAFGEFKYVIRVFEGLQRRLTQAPDDPAFAIDILAVEITQIQPVKGSKRLTECRCTDGTQLWKIVTNIQKISSGQHRACAVLPPSEFMGVVSEGMFLTDEELSQETPLGLLQNPPMGVLEQARAQVKLLTKRLM